MKRTICILALLLAGCSAAGNLDPATPSQPPVEPPIVPEEPVDPPEPPKEVVFYVETNKQLPLLRAWRRAGSLIDSYIWITNHHTRVGGGTASVPQEERIDLVRTDYPLTVRIAKGSTPWAATIPTNSYHGGRTLAPGTAALNAGAIEVQLKPTSMWWRVKHNNPNYNDIYFAWNGVFTDIMPLKDVPGVSHEGNRRGEDLQFYRHSTAGTEIWLRPSDHDGSKMNAGVPQVNFIAEPNSPFTTMGVQRLPAYTYYVWFATSKDGTKVIADVQADVPAGFTSSLYDVNLLTGEPADLGTKQLLLSIKAKVESPAGSELASF